MARQREMELSATRRQTFTGVVAGIEKREQSSGHTILRLLVDDVRNRDGTAFGERVYIQCGNAINALKLGCGECIAFDGVPSSIPVWGTNGGRIARNIPGATNVRRLETTDAGRA